MSLRGRQGKEKRSMSSREHSCTIVSLWAVERQQFVSLKSPQDSVKMEVGFASKKTYNPNNPNSLVLPRSHGVFPRTVAVAFAGLPFCAMHQLSREIVDSFDVRPLPPTQWAHSSEKYIGTVFKLLYFTIFVGALDTQIPFSSGLWINSARQTMLQLNEWPEVVFVH